MYEPELSLSRFPEKNVYEEFPVVITYKGRENGIYNRGITTTGIIVKFVSVY